ncbi:maleylpyruvate isomerase family mycothiol-dependent enzyme [soil metagenome]
MTDQSDLHASVADNFAAVIAQTTRWDAPTPVAEWQARDIVDHLITWPMPVLEAWAGLRLSDDPSASLNQRWKDRTAQLQAVLEDPAVASRTVTEGPFAGQPASLVIDRAYTADVFMHTWDLAAAAGQPTRLDPDYARSLLDGLRPIEQVLRDSGQYGPAHPTDSNDPIDQLMAFIGRDPSWQSQ